MAGERSLGGELQLLGAWISPWVIRARVALEMKGLSYEYIEQDLQQKSDLLLRSNPVHKKVPVLIHDGRPVCESLVVLEYLDEAFAGTGPSLLPADPYDRATARFWASYVNGTFFPAWRALFRSTTAEQRAEAFKDVLPQVETLDRAFGECSKGKAFFGGDDVGIVDLALGSFLVWIRVVDELAGTNLLDGTKLAAWGSWLADWNSWSTTRGSWLNWLQHRLVLADWNAHLVVLPVRCTMRNSCSLLRA